MLTFIVLEILVTYFNRVNTIGSILQSPEEGHSPTSSNWCNLNESFPCKMHKRCIPKSWSCDGENDCIDGEDEKHCGAFINKTCSVDHYRCATIDASDPYICVPHSRVCDKHADCVHGDDEFGENCHLNNQSYCEDNQFKCHSGWCVRNTLICNGQRDCPDGSDEKSPTCDVASISCRNHLQCPNSTICINRADLCDGYNDCGDNVDEDVHFCNKTDCESMHVKCPSGRCIPETWQCDGDDDCRGGWDEGEKCKNDTCLGSYIFVCNTGKCINRAFICDGENDCEDGSDEDNHRHSCGNRTCRYDEYNCKANRNVGKYECIPKSWLCDSTVNCADGADENLDNCPGHTLKPCNKWEFQCTNGKCLPEVFACDHENDCMDGSDEFNCTYPACDSSYFMCNNSRCLPKTFLCDGTNDCADGSDELNCSIINRFTTENSSLHEYNDDCSSNEYKCTNGECISQSFLCNNVSDCSDGTDESSTLCIAPYLLLANRVYIRKLYLNNRNDKQKIVAQWFNNIPTIDYEVKENVVYFCDQEQQRVYRLPLAKNDKFEPEKTLKRAEPILKATPIDIAVDWIGKNLYMLNSRTLRVLRLDGRHVKNLLEDRFSKPTSLAVCPQKAFVFFTESSLSSYIGRIDMDGSNFVKIVSKDLGWPKAITVDYHSERIYFGDDLKQLKSCDFNGNGCKTVPVKNVFNIWSVAVFDNDIYWLDGNVNTIFKANKINGSHETTLTTAIHSLVAIKIFHPSLQAFPSVLHPCQINNGNCTQLCLLSNVKAGFKCACTENFELAKDHHKCEAHCGPNQMKCGSSDEKCIPLTWKCDGEKDCLDGSDEPDTCPIRTCGMGQFQCKLGKCIPLTLMCDGLSTCGEGDESDKNACNYTCSPWEFKCNNGGCISNRFVCDNDYNDCHDNSDENTQLCHNFTRTCTPEEFKCSNGKCIPSSSVCDKQDDCLDGSDEPYTCKNRNCPRGWIRCKSSYRCIPNWLFCNGVNDCLDGSDELPEMCPDDCDLAGHFRCNSTRRCISRGFLCNGEDNCSDNSDEANCIATLKNCSESEFRCKNDRCVSGNVICDGTSDCYDNSDEENCTQFTCQFGKKQCISNGICIDENSWCNRRRDCSDASDELNCSNVHRRKCADFEFECKNGVCINKRLLCDNYNDCGDASDEINANCSILTEDKNCSNLDFRCKNGRQCVAQYSICDGNFDCDDHSDEENCLHFTCPELTRKCANGVMCLDVATWCDGYKHCSDGSDELNCSHVQLKNCSEGQFRCSNGFCIEKYKLCDGNNNCGDYSDEIHEACTNITCNNVTEFECHKSKVCTRRTNLCDNVTDCGPDDNSDETLPMCSFQCKESEFKCANKEKCISYNLRCNRFYDCTDHSDEFGCLGNIWKTPSVIKKPRKKVL